MFHSFLSWHISKSENLTKDNINVLFKYCSKSTSLSNSCRAVLLHSAATNMASMIFRCIQALYATMLFDHHFVWRMLRRRRINIYYLLRDKIDIFLQKVTDLEGARLVRSYWDPEKTGARLTFGIGMSLPPWFFLDYHWTHGGLVEESIEIRSRSCEER